MPCLGTAGTTVLPVLAVLDLVVLATRMHEFGWQKKRAARCLEISNDVVAETLGKVVAVIGLVYPIIVTTTKVPTLEELVGELSGTNNATGAWYSCNALEAEPTTGRLR